MTINLTNINNTDYWPDNLTINSTTVDISLIIVNDSSQVQTNLQRNGVLFIIVTTLILAILTICTVIGNILVIAAVLLERNLRIPANYLVLSLAVADCLVACLVMPLGAFYEIQGEWSLGDLLCELWITVDVLCCTARYINISDNKYSKLIYK
jgi:5-hydroxytryptamine receptor 1